MPDWSVTVTVAVLGLGEEEVGSLRVRSVRRERSKIQDGEGAEDQGVLPPDFGMRGMWFLVAV